MMRLPDRDRHRRGDHTPARENTSGRCPSAIDLALKQVLAQYRFDGDAYDGTDYVHTHVEVDW